MYKFFLFTFIFLSTCFFGQKKYSTTEILKIFPFNKATKIKMISYNTDFVSEFPTPLPPVGKNGDSTMIKKIIANQTLPIKLEKILGKQSIDGINHSKTLTFQEIFELVSLLYNTCGKFKNDLREGNKCFFPRNAILFYDENDKVFETLEICFECYGMKFSLDKSQEINSMCDDFYSKLEKLFRENNFDTRPKRNY